MVFSETIYAMLMTHDKFRQFTPKTIADAKTSNQVLFCLSADSRDEVDEIVGKAAGRGRGGRSQPEGRIRLHVRPQLRGSGWSHVGRELDGHGSRPARSPPWRTPD